MIRRTVLYALACCSIQGCSSDLFHDTTWLSACERDPQTNGCAPAGDAAHEGSSSNDAGQQIDAAAD